MKKVLTTICYILLVVTTSKAQDLNATDIVKKADDNIRGKSLYSEVKMTIVRPTWKREVDFKSWSKGDDYALVLITGPAKDKGQSFLKRQNDLWNWQPSIGRMIKMSSSVMGQSWMGSDFTNDDLVKESSPVNDYTHTLEKTEAVREFDCYKIILIPKENAAVVWGKVIMWISKIDFIEVKSEFYDEEYKLINTINGFDIQSYGSRKLPSRIEVVPADKPNQKTIMTTLRNDFDKPIDESFFSQQNMKTVK